MDISPAVISRSIASMQMQVLGSLFGSNSAGNGDVFSALLSQQIGLDNTGTAALNPSAGVGGPSSTGRNSALFDPESAYNMMSLIINSSDALYKAQYSELSQMKTGVARMQAAGQGLGDITAAPADEIQARLQHFVAQYNDWRQSFGPDVQQGALLAGTQAAQVSLYELEQSVENIFNGATDGIHGLGDLGITIDPETHLAALDTRQFQAALSTNPQGALNAVHEFGANFAKSAGLLNADNNFIPSQLDNLGRAIHYIADNEDALTQEFGTGDAAKPTGKEAQALAAYNRNYP